MTGTTGIPTRALGGGGLTTSAIGYGAMVLSPGVYGETDDDRAVTALHAALDEGATLIDTSDGYGPDGHNERLVGRALAGGRNGGSGGRRREQIVIATKFGFRRPEGVEGHAFPVSYTYGELAVNADPKYVRGYAEASLRNLRTDVIDLYYPHFPDPVVPVEDTVGAVAELIADGLVRHLGLSDVTADQLRRAHAVHPVAAQRAQEGQARGRSVGAPRSTGRRSRARPSARPRGRSPGPGPSCRELPHAGRRGGDRR
jgi:aryl-alcohol dehydrogenase-like predicted oxidoreductase